MDGSFTLRKSLAFRSAKWIDAKGDSFVPLLLSFPFGATQISAANADAETNSKNGSNKTYFLQKFITHYRIAGDLLSPILIYLEVLTVIFAGASPFAVAFS